MSNISFFDLKRVLGWRTPSADTFRRYQQYFLNNRIHNCTLYSLQIELIGRKHFAWVPGIILSICCATIMLDLHMITAFIIGTVAWCTVVWALVGNSNATTRYLKDIVEDLHQHAVFISRSESGMCLLVIYDRSKHVIRLFPITYSQLESPWIQSLSRVNLPISLMCRLMAGEISSEEFKKEEVVGLVAGTVYQINSGTKR